MFDAFKLMLGSVHDLPLPLRHGFVVLFFTSALLFALTFKRWLEMRRVSKDADLWAHTPVSMTVAQVLLWVVWATGAIYATYDATPKVALAPAHKSASAAPAHKVSAVAAAAAAAAPALTHTHASVAPAAPATAHHASSALGAPVPPAAHHATHSATGSPAAPAAPR